MGDGPMYMLTLISGILSGIYLPLQLWPDFMQKFLILQPFAGYADIPARLYLGTISINESMFAMAVQIVWIVIFIVIGRMIMKNKLKNVIVQGG